MSLSRKDLARHHLQSPDVETKTPGRERAWAEVRPLKVVQPAGIPGCLLPHSPGEEGGREGRKEKQAAKGELEELFPQGIFNSKLLAKAKIKN